jgi:pimeloyl-ACP methyl ester carboxylesterase
MSLKKTILWTGGALVVAAAIASAGFLLRPVSYFNRLTYVKEGFSGIQSKTVTVEGRRMHYLAAGPANGPAVVLVHGLGGSAEDWLSLFPYLTRAGYRVYMPDLFGYGRSDKPADFSYSVRDESAAVIAFLDALNLKQVDLGGWSMGGWIVQLDAIAFPEHVRRLMLFDSAGLYAPPAWNTNLFTPANTAELDQLDALLMPHPPAVPGFVARDILRVSDQRAWIMHRAIDSMMTGMDTTDALLPHLQMPVLIAWGSLDRITPPELASRMHQYIPQSDLEMVDGCGHLAPRQCAAQMGPRVVAFLQR